MNTTTVNVLYLAAGYGTRLERDLKNSTYSHLIGTPKALIPLLGIPLLQHWYSKFSTSRQFIVCNSTHYPLFVEWAKSVNFPINNILKNNSTTNDNRLGSVKDLSNAVSHFSLQNEHLIVIAGDTLIKQFNIDRFIQTCSTIPGSVVLNYKVSDEECLKSGILETSLENDLNRVVGFLEKPSPNDTPSRLGCPCFYYLSPDALRTLPVFLQAKGADCELKEIDAAGRWIEWLIHQVPVYTLPIVGRLDIGGLPSYIEAEKYLQESSNLVID
ncbi:nucleotide-diphospho-sugar transferase [Globomyces pollinis-pini]|nr:nucleotide-diphospho-sugar transferase [Globomyces pollinis-pini]